MDKNYLFLFNALTDVIAKLDALRNNIVVLQQNAEEMYISIDNED